MSSSKLDELTDKERLYIAHLISCALKGKAPEEKPKELSWEQIYKICSYHSIISTVYPAVKGMKDRSGDESDTLDALMSKWKESYQKAIAKELTFNIARTEILSQFEEEGIKYLPLKGILLKDYYPSAGLRMFADNDILYAEDRNKDVKRIMEQLGYQTESFEKWNHDVYLKPPVFNFEMHRTLMGLDSSYYEYYTHVWERAEKDDGNLYGYHMTIEDFYIYFVTHAYKHYSYSGTGIRTILDQYLFLRKEEELLNRKYVIKELGKLGLSDFEQSMKRLGVALFSGDKLADMHLTEEEWVNYRYIFSLGTYGTLSNKFINQFTKFREPDTELHKSKIKYYFRRIFPSREWMKVYFPITAKYPVLYRPMVIARMFRVFRKWKLIKKEILTIRDVTK